MASPPIPPSLEYLAGRPFSFYPPILNVEQNEWIFRKATWSEIQVANQKSGLELWISRRYVGEASRIEDPVLIVGLLRELELKGGMVVPCQRRVLEMPAAVGPPPRPEQASGTAPAPRRRLDETDRRVVRLLLTTMGVLVVLYLAGLSFFRVGELRQKNAVLVGTDQMYAGLGSHDDYVGVIQKLGQPATDRQQESGTILYRALGYPERRYTVILMGRDQISMSYIGTVDRSWRPIHSVNAQTESLLHQLPSSLKTGR